MISCIDPAGIDPAEFNDYLVVEGFITDEPGPHLIKISRVAEFSGILQGGVINTVTDATVTIIENGTNRILLDRAFETIKEIECNPRSARTSVRFVDIPIGYQTSTDFEGKLNHTYELEIRANGEVYNSTPQTLLPSPEIESILLEFKDEPTTNDVVRKSGIEVFSTWQDPIETDNYYFWKLSGIYPVETPPIPDALGNGPCPACVYDPDDRGAEECFITEKEIEENLLAFSDEMTNGARITKSIGFVEDDGKRFVAKNVEPDRQYFLEVEQYSITKENFEFNQTINTLKEIDGEIFDPPPLSISGNLFNASNSEDVIIGYFGAYQTQRKSLFIPKSILTFTQPKQPQCGDCRRLRGASTQVPEVYQ